MNKEVKQKWIDALRSGEYAQTVGVLKEKFSNGKDAFCCLGVLCDLYAKETSAEWIYNRRLGRYSFLEMVDLPPRDVEKWANIDSDEEFVHKDEQGLVISSNTLYDFNDLHGLTFEEIADIVEEQL